MKYSIFKLSMFLVLSSFSFLGIAQSDTQFDGKYIGKFEFGGFEDSLIIENGSISHIHNPSWGYGVEHQFVYNMIPLKGEMVTFEQVAFLKDRVEQDPQSELGEMNGQTVVLSKDGDGNLQIIVPGHSNKIALFKKVD